MLALLVALCAQAPDWSGFGLRERLGDAEAAGARARIVAWITRLGAPAERLKVIETEERPVYRVVVETLDEERRVERVSRPHEGGIVGPHAVTEADPWAPPLPAFDGWEERSWLVPVAGSERLLTCKPCAGKGMTDCRNCGGDGSVSCTPCLGSGRVGCGACAGSGYGPCERCGRRGKGAKCTLCRRARPSCATCRNGTVLCVACNGHGVESCAACKDKGRFPCGGCGTKGRVVEGLRVVIALKLRRAEQVVTALDAKWIDRVPAWTGGWLRATAEELEAAAARVPDAELRARLPAVAERERTGKERVRAQRVSVLRTPATFVRFEMEATTYDAVLAGDAVVCDGSPAEDWAASRGRTAVRLAAEGRAEEARKAAREAMRVDPRNADAKRALEEADRGAGAEAPSPSPAPRPRSTGGDFEVSNATFSLIIVVGLLAMVLVVVMAIWLGGAKGTGA